MLTISLMGCGKSSKVNVKIDYGTSCVYTEKDMNNAIDIIKEKLNSWGDFRLYSLSYSSDDECNNAENIEWMNELEEANDNKEVFTQCIMFDSCFRPIKGDAVWGFEEHTWSWWLARSEGGEWKLMTWGY